MKTYIISYTKDGQPHRDTKTTSLKTHAVKRHFAGLGCENIKVRLSA